MKSDSVSLVLQDDMSEKSLVLAHFVLVNTSGQSDSLDSAADLTVVILTACTTCQKFTLTEIGKI